MVIKVPFKLGNCQMSQTTSVNLSEELGHQFLEMFPGLKNGLHHGVVIGFCGFDRRIAENSWIYAVCVNRAF